MSALRLFAAKRKETHATWLDSGAQYDPNAQCYPSNISVSLTVAAAFYNAAQLSSF